MLLSYSYPDVYACRVFLYFAWRRYLPSSVMDLFMYDKDFLIKTFYETVKSNITFRILLDVRATLYEQKLYSDFDEKLLLDVWTVPKDFFLFFVSSVSFLFLHVSFRTFPCTHAIFVGSWKKRSFIWQTAKTMSPASFLLSFGGRDWPSSQIGR